MNSIGRQGGLAPTIEQASKASPAPQQAAVILYARPGTTPAPGMPPGSALQRSATRIAMSHAGAPDPAARTGTGALTGRTPPRLTHGAEGRPLGALLRATGAILGVLLRLPLVLR